MVYKYFLSLYMLPFILFGFFFAVKNFLVWCSPGCWFLPLLSIILLSYPRNLIAKAKIKEIFLWFLLGV